MWQARCVSEKCWAALLLRRWQQLWARFGLNDGDQTPDDPWFRSAHALAITALYRPEAVSPHLSQRTTTLPPARLLAERVLVIVWSRRIRVQSTCRDHAWSGTQRSVYLRPAKVLEFLPIGAAVVCPSTVTQQSGLPARYVTRHKPPDRHGFTSRGSDLIRRRYIGTTMEHARFPSVSVDAGIAAVAAGGRGPRHSFPPNCS